MTLKKHPKRKLFTSFLTKTNETPSPSQTTKKTQPRSQSSSAISDVTSPVKLRAIALGSKPPLVTRIARTGLGTRLKKTYNNNKTTTFCCITEPLFTDLTSLIMQVQAIAIFDKFEIVFF